MNGYKAAYYNSYSSVHTIDINNPSPEFTQARGGEFLMDPEWFTAAARLPASYADPMRGNDWFEAFCLERSEHTQATDTGTQFRAGISEQAEFGGVGGGSPDPISPQTAYLYNRFIAGSLSGYHYSKDSPDDAALRHASADALQDAIWYLEDELPGINVQHMSTLAQSFIADALANADGMLGGASALNLIDEQAQALQSVLVTVFDQ